MSSTTHAPTPPKQANGSPTAHELDRKRVKTETAY